MSTLLVWGLPRWEPSHLLRAGAGFEPKLNIHRPPISSSLPLLHGDPRGNINHRRAYSYSNRGWGGVPTFRHKDFSSWLFTLGRFVLSYGMFVFMHRAPQDLGMACAVSFLCNIIYENKAI